MTPADRVAFAGNTARLRAHGFVRHMRGGSRAALIDTDGGHFVVKWQQNPQHRRILINEAICGELLSLFGVASPGWALIHADADFLESNPELAIADRPGCLDIQPGWHFGSRFAADSKTESAREELPAHTFRRISNLDDFAKALVFDCWVDNRDRRQALFVRDNRSRWSAKMIDNGHALGFDGTEWSFTSTPMQQCHPLFEPHVGTTTARRAYAQIIGEIEGLRRSDLEDLLGRLPPEWIEDDEKVLSRQLDRLIDRGKRMTEMVADYTYCRPAA